MPLLFKKCRLLATFDLVTDQLFVLLLTAAALASLLGIAAMMIMVLLVVVGVEGIAHAGALALGAGVEFKVADGIAA